MSDCSLAFENIGILSESHERLWADTEGRLSYVGWCNFPARIYSWIQELLFGSEEKKTEEAVLRTFESLAAIKTPDPRIVRVCLETLADRSHFSDQVRQAAFQALRASSPNAEPGYHSYSENIFVKSEAPAEIYGQIVQSMPIPCVDVFVYNPDTDCYLMLLRSNAPAKGTWWLPGGRVYKGESFFATAARKTQMESGIVAIPIAKLGTYTTYFPDSAWGDAVATDSKNVVVLALAGRQDTSCDQDHEGSKWVPMREAPADPYLREAYLEAKSKLAEFGF